MNGSKRIYIAAAAVLLLLACPMFTVAGSSADAGAYDNAGAGYGDGMTVTYLEKNGDEYATLKVTFDTSPESDILLTMDSSRYAPVPASEMSGNLLDIYVNKLSQGTHNLHAEFDDFSEDVSFTVVPYVPVSSVSINMEAAEVYVGGTVDLRAIVAPDNVTLSKEFWSSSDESVATVDNGKVTGIKEGNAVISVTVDGMTADCLVSVASDVEIKVVENDDGSKTITETNKSTGTVKVTNSKETVGTDGSVTTVATSETKDKDGNVLTSEKSTEISKDGTTTVSSETKDKDGNTVVETVSNVATDLKIENGVTVATVPASASEEAARQIDAIGNAYGEGTKTVRIGIDSTSNQVKAQLSPDAVSKIASIENAELKVDTKNGSVVLDSNAVSKMSGAKGDVSISIGVVDKSTLTDDQKEAIGDREIYELKLTEGSEQITDLGGKATVSVPYSLKEGEDGSKIAVWSLNESNGLDKLDGASYGSDAGDLTFSTDHSGIYAAGQYEEHDDGISPAVIAAIICVIAVAAVAIFILIRKMPKSGSSQ